MTASKHPIFDSLMNKAYDRYTPEMTHAQFTAQLVGLEVLAVHYGNLNYQVENGGFSQWQGNHYQTDASLGAIRTLLTMVNTDEARQVQSLIDQFVALGDQNDVDDDDLDAWGDSENSLCKAFYQINDTVIDQIEAVFASMTQTA